MGSYSQHKQPLAVFHMQFDFGSENVPERDPTVVQNGIAEMKGILTSLENEKVSCVHTCTCT